MVVLRSGPHPTAPLGVAKLQVAKGYPIAEAAGLTLPVWPTETVSCTEHADTKEIHSVVHFIAKNVPSSGFTSI